MKQDIRGLFKNENRFEKQLPENHREDFLQKLKAEKLQPQPSWLWMKIAAVLIIALTIGFLMLPNTSNEVKVSPIVAQIEAMEDEYLKDINAEWENFVAVTDDDVLIERFRKKLEDLDKDYQDISIQFKSDINNILIIEALLENLQTRLQLLKDIQQHIKILNQKKQTA